MLALRHHSDNNKQQQTTTNRSEGPHLFILQQKNYFQYKHLSTMKTIRALLLLPLFWASGQSAFYTNNGALESGKHETRVLVPAAEAATLIFQMEEDLSQQLEDGLILDLHLGVATMCLFTSGMIDDAVTVFACPLSLTEDEYYKSLLSVVITKKYLFFLYKVVDGQLVRRSDGLIVARPSEYHALLQQALQNLGGGTTTLQEVWEELKKMGYWINRDWAEELFRAVPKPSIKSSKNVFPRAPRRKVMLRTPKILSTPMAPGSRRPGIARPRFSRTPINQRVLDLIHESAVRENDCRKDAHNFDLAMVKQLGELVDLVEHMVEHMVDQMESIGTRREKRNQEVACSEALLRRQLMELDLDAEEEEDHTLGRLVPNTPTAGVPKASLASPPAPSGVARMPPASTPEVEFDPVARAQQEAWNMEQQQQQEKQQSNQEELQEEDSKPAAVSPKKPASTPTPKCVRGVRPNTPEQEHVRGLAVELSKEFQGEDEDADLLKEEQKTHKCSRCGANLAGDQGFCRELKADGSTCMGARAASGASKGWDDIPGFAFDNMRKLKAGKAWRCDCCDLIYQEGVNCEIQEAAKKEKEKQALSGEPTTISFGGSAFGSSSNTTGGLPLGGMAGSAVETGGFTFGGTAVTIGGFTFGGSAAAATTGAGAFAFGNNVPAAPPGGFDFGGPSSASGEGSGGDGGGGELVFGAASASTPAPAAGESTGSGDSDGTENHESIASFAELAAAMSVLVLVGGHWVLATVVHSTRRGVTVTLVSNGQKMKVTDHGSIRVWKPHPH